MFIFFSCDVWFRVWDNCSSLNVLEQEKTIHLGLSLQHMTFRMPKMKIKWTQMHFITKYIAINGFCLGVCFEFGRYISFWLKWYSFYMSCLGVSASQMLSRFCNFVKKHQFHHDTALLLTRYLKIKPFYWQFYLNVFLIPKVYVIRVC